MMMSVFESIRQPDFADLSEKLQEQAGHFGNSELIPDLGRHEAMVSLIAP
jgi:hypothetical protein